MTSALGFRLFSSRTSWTSRRGEMSCVDGRTQGAGAPATYAARLSAQSTRSTSPKGQLPVARNQGLD